ncbi:DUF3566 domain-containing protein [Kitasatospora sp. NPDC088134]|uniref:DUF3566 domain-containing protein n=1 Tax=Kitasatospora sp. NPDC088134 TaxID=3364071 RepID=UPI00381CE994
MSGATGAGGATGGVSGGQGGVPYGTPQRPAEHPASSTSVMPPVGQAGGQQGYGGQTPPPPPSAPPTAGGGFSTPTTYTKGQPTPPRGTRTTGAGSPGQGQGPARRPGGGTPAAGTGRTRKARLRVVKADPWSVMKVSFLLSLAIGVIVIVAAAVLWMTLDGLGVFDSLTSTFKDITGTDSSGAFNLMDYIGFGKVMLFTTLIAVVDVVLMTALCTLAAFIYNSAAGFTGGIELTLAEED